MVELRRDLDESINDLLKNDKFNIYYEYLIAENQHTNLTRIVEENEVYYKHFYDSIILSKFLDLKGKKFLDVGAGAGFPSIPLKIIEPSIKLTIVDSLNKRIRFLTGLSEKLGLNDIELIHGRAEELAKKHYFDIVTSRAVARLNILAEITIPFVKTGGYFIAYKSINYKEELEEATNCITTLGGRIDRIEHYSISKEESRVLIFIKKIKETKKGYPRQFGKIKKQPL